MSGTPCPRRSKKFYAMIAILLLSALLTCWPPAIVVAQAQGRRMIPEKQLGAATASYFPKARHVTVQVTPLRVAGDMQNGIVLIPSFIVPGKKVVEPKLINLQFIVDASAGAPATPFKVQIFSESRELASGVPRLVSAGKPAGGSMTRVLMYQLPYAKFLQMLKGKEVRVRLGRAEFDLTEDQLASMRDLQRMIAEGVSFP